MKAKAFTRGFADGFTFGGVLTRSRLFERQNIPLTSPRTDSLTPDPSGSEAKLRRSRSAASARPLGELIPHKEK